MSGKNQSSFSVQLYVDYSEKVNARIADAGTEIMTPRAHARLHLAVIPLRDRSPGSCKKKIMSCYWRKLKVLLVLGPVVPGIVVKCPNNRQYDYPTSYRTYRLRTFTPTHTIGFSVIKFKLTNLS